MNDTTPQRDRVLYDGLYTLVLRLVNVAGAAALGILTARFLGPGGKGLYALPGVQAGLVAAVFGGVTSATSYFLLNRRVGRAILGPAFAASGLFVVAGAITVAILAYASKELWAAVPAIASLPAAAAISLGTGYVVGIKRVRVATTITLGVTLVTFFLMLTGFVFVGRSALLAVGIWLGANLLVGAVVAIGIVVHARRLESHGTVGFAEFMRFALNVGVVALVTLLNYRADLYIVAILASPAALGMYTVAVSAAESLLVPTQVAALVTSPHIGSLDTPAAGRLAARCVRNNLLVALCVCGLLFVFAQPIVALLYGAAFAPVVPALRILLIGVVALSLGSPMSNYFTLKLGRPTISLWLATGSAAVCIGVSAVLVPQIGILGAALGSTAAYLAGQVASTWYFMRLTRLSFAEVLIPTGADVGTYVRFLARVLHDGRRLLRASVSIR